MRDRRWGIWEDTNRLLRACEDSDAVFMEVHGVQGLPLGSRALVYEKCREGWEGSGEV